MQVGVNERGERDIREDVLNNIFTKLVKKFKTRCTLFRKLNMYGGGLRARDVLVHFLKILPSRTKFKTYYAYTKHNNYKK